MPIICRGNRYSVASRKRRDGRTRGAYRFTAIEAIPLVSSATCFQSLRRKNSKLKSISIPRRRRAESVRESPLLTAPHRIRRSYIHADTREELVAVAKNSLRTDASNQLIGGRRKRRSHSSSNHSANVSPTLCRLTVVAVTTRPRTVVPVKGQLAREGSFTPNALRCGVLRYTARHRNATQRIQRERAFLPASKLNKKQRCLAFLNAEKTLVLCHMLTLSFINSRGQLTEGKFLAETRLMVIYLQRKNHNFSSSLISFSILQKVFWRSKKTRFASLYNASEQPTEILFLLPVRNS